MKHCLKEDLSALVFSEIGNSRLSAILTVASAAKGKCCKSIVVRYASVAQHETITGVVERLTFYSSKSGSTAARLTRPRANLGAIAMARILPPNLVQLIVDTGSISSIGDIYCSIASCISLNLVTSSKIKKYYAEIKIW
ncbi:MAG: hypothetical protein V7L01_19375 [Nostoc sp.]|uniref:hypothetical protein n=1 Tax=Nostoc sp. TaxID=1180 RepID=UPI002FF63575